MPLKTCPCPARKFHLEFPELNESTLRHTNTNGNCYTKFDFEDAEDLEVTDILFKNHLNNKLEKNKVIAKSA